MSIRPGLTVYKDPDASLVYTWDWSDWLVGAAQISTSTFTITPPADEPVSLLTKDNESIVTGNLSTKVRLIGGTEGSRYTVSNRVVTNESPTQTDDRSITVVIRAR